MNFEDLEDSKQQTEVVGLCLLEEEEDVALCEGSIVVNMAHSDLWVSRMSPTVMGRVKASVASQAEAASHSFAPAEASPRGREVESWPAS